MCEASSDARKATTPVSSSGSPIEPSGVRSMISRSRSGVQSRRLSVDSTAMNPGPSAFTRTLGANAPAYDFVRPNTPYFEAAYCGARGLPVTTTLEQTLTMTPPPALHHARAKFMAHEQCSLDVDCYDAIEDGFAQLTPASLLRRNVADVVHKDIQTPRLSKDVVRHSLHLVPARNVRLDHDAVATKATNLLREHGGAFARAVVVGDDVCPLAGKTPGHVHSETAPGARHERPLILKASCPHCLRLYNKCLIRRRATGHGSAGLTATRPILPIGIDRPSARGSCSTAPTTSRLGGVR